MSMAYFIFITKLRGSHTSIIQCPYWPSYFFPFLISRSSIWIRHIFSRDMRTVPPRPQKSELRFSSFSFQAYFTFYYTGDKATYFQFMCFVETDVIHSRFGPRPRPAFSVLELDYNYRIQCIHMYLRGVSCLTRLRFSILFDIDVVLTAYQAEGK